MVMRLEVSGWQEPSWTMTLYRDVSVRLDTVKNGLVIGRYMDMLSVEISHDKMLPLKSLSWTVNSSLSKQTAVSGVNIPASLFEIFIILVESERVLPSPTV